jgi:hypothetical protein
MAQATYTPIQLYYSTTAAAVPTSGNLANGELALNISDMKLYAKNSAGTVTLLASSAAAAGVTSVAQSFTGGIVSVAGSPITTSGTLALTVAGTSGGVPYFTSASTWATSALLTQYGVLYGGGAGAAPAATAAGTNGQVLTATTGGAPAWANPSTSGTVTSVAATVPSVFSISGSPITSSGTLAITYSGTALPVANGGTSLTTLTANNVILGNGTSAPTFVAPSTSGNVLTSNGTTWTSSALAAPTAVGSTLYLSNYYGAF